MWYVSAADTVLIGADARHGLQETLTIPAAGGAVEILARDEVGNRASLQLGWLDQAFAALHSGGEHACTLTAAGAGYCVGPDSLGQLGDGPPNVAAAVPVPVAGGRTLVAIRAGVTTTCALDETGSAHCWGNNRYGQLGDGSRTDRPAPAPVAGGHAFSELHPAAHSTCALDVHGTAFCWGLLPHLAGDGTVAWDTVSSPRAVSAPQPFVSLRLDPRGSHVCGVDAAGAAYCWGRRIGYDATADPAAYDTAAVRVDDGPIALVQPVSDVGSWSRAAPWTFALTDDGVPTTLGGTGDLSGIQQEFGAGPYHNVIVDEGSACLLYGNDVVCPSSAFDAATAVADARQLGIAAETVTAAPCFLTGDGSLYCRPLSP